MHESAIHKNMGELFGFVCWFWIFYRAKEDGAVTIESDTYVTGHASFLGECDFGGEADGYISFISEMTVGPTEDSPLFTVNGYDGTILGKGTLQITATTNVQKLVSRITCRLSSSHLCSLAPAHV